jgi:hypothetical protein
LPPISRSYPAVIVTSNHLSNMIAPYSFIPSATVTLAVTLAVTTSRNMIPN